MIFDDDECDICKSAGVTCLYCINEKRDESRLTEKLFALSAANATDIADEYEADWHWTKSLGNSPRAGVRGSDPHGSAAPYVSAEGGMTFLNNVNEQVFGCVCSACGLEGEVTEANLRECLDYASQQCMVKSRGDARQVTDDAGDAKCSKAVSDNLREEQRDGDCDDDSSDVESVASTAFTDPEGWRTNGETDYEGFETDDGPLTHHE